MCNLAGNDAIIVSDTLAKYNYQVGIASWLDGSQMQQHHTSRFSLLQAAHCTRDSLHLGDGDAMDAATGVLAGGEAAVC